MMIPVPQLRSSAANTPGRRNEPCIVPFMNFRSSRSLKTVDYGRQFTGVVLPDCGRLGSGYGRNYESSPNPLFGTALWRPLYKGRRSAAPRPRFQGAIFPKQLSLFYGGSTGFGKGVLRYVQRHYACPSFPCGAQ